MTQAALLPYFQVEMLLFVAWIKAGTCSNYSYMFHKSHKRTWVDANFILLYVLLTLIDLLNYSHKKSRTSFSRYGFFYEY
ncbi:MAG: hypothetical protein JWP57_2029 [Spirosoma sp.]|nr:hypothetical protein [Spirosoma sp.]